jgi:hypothetical protein
MQSMGHCPVILSPSLKIVSSVVSKHGFRQKKADTANMLVRVSVKPGEKTSVCPVNKIISKASPSMV